MLKYTILPQSLSYSKVFSVKPAEVNGLYQLLCQIPDPRRAQGRRHPLGILLTLAVLALSCGQVGYQSIQEWVENYQDNLVKKVPFLATHLINGSTFQRVFSRIETFTMEQVLGQFIQQTTGYASSEPISIDGKTISGVDCHLLSAFAALSKSVLFESGTDTKGKEIPLALDLLDNIPVKGHIITADALHTQRKFCQKVTTLGGGYCLTAKGNQEQLAKDLRLFFNQLPFKAKTTTFTKNTKAKGKLTSHTILTSQDLVEYLAWPGVTHVWQLTREVTAVKTQQTTTEVVVGIARLLNQTNPEQQIIDLVRGHWSIENNLHRQRDVIFLEDRSTIRSGSAPQVMAALKNLILSLFNRSSVRYFPTAFRRFLAAPDELFDLLGLTNVAI